MFVRTLMLMGCIFISGLNTIAIFDKMDDSYFFKHPLHNSGISTTKDYVSCRWLIIWTNLLFCIIIRN